VLKIIDFRFCITALVIPFLAHSQTPGAADTKQKQQIVVTGTWQPVPLEESDRSVESYALPDSALLFTSPADVFSLDSSVQVQGRAPNGVQGDLSIRGGSFAQTLVLLN